MGGRAKAFSIAAALAFFARPAFANDPAAAQELFDQAQALMRQQRWAEACPKLEESQRLDPGDGTVLHLAACREHEGKIATAWALYEDALVAAKRTNNKDRRRIAQDRIEYLTPRLHRLRLKVASGDKKLASFKIVRDDTSIGAALWNEPFPIDPGAHTIIATADGYKKWSRSIDIPTSSGETTVDVPVLEPEPSAAPAKPKEEPKKLTIEEATRGDSQRTIGLAVGGIGVAGLVTGAIFGAFAFSKQSQADSNCAPPDFTKCSQAGVDAGKAGETFGNVSTIAFIAGGALAVGGAVLYFTAPEHGGVGLAITPSSVSLAAHW
jgi:hypothetical protein